MRIQKVVKAFGSQTIGTSPSTLETQSVKALGDVLSWSLYIDFTSVHSAGTFQADGGTPSGSWAGSSVFKLLKQISIKDNQNTDLFLGNESDIWVMAYMISLIDPNEFLFERGQNQRPTTDAADQTNQLTNIIIPQTILAKDLPASLEIQLGVLSDYFATVSSSTATINELTVTFRYAPPAQSGFTVRCKAFNISTISADSDIAYLLPNNINFLAIGYFPDNPNAGTAPANMTNTNVKYISVRRGSNEEIEQIRRAIIDYFVDHAYANTRPTGFTVINTDAFSKTDSTLFKFFLNGSVSLTPRVYYVYR